MKKQKILLYLFAILFVLYIPWQIYSSIGFIAAGFSLITPAEFISLFFPFAKLFVFFAMLSIICCVVSFMMVIKRIGQFYPEYIKKRKAKHEENKIKKIQKLEEKINRIKNDKN